MVIVECAKECIYLREMLKEVKIKDMTDITVHCDNRSAMKLAKTLHSTSIFVTTSFETCSKMDSLESLTYQRQVADMLTKALSKSKHECVNACEISRR